MPLNTSAPTVSLAKTWDDSLKFQTAQQKSQESSHTHSLHSQATSFAPSSGTGKNAGATQKRGGSTRGDFSRSTWKSPTFQPSRRQEPIVNTTGRGFFGGDYYPLE